MVPKVAKKGQPSESQRKVMGKFVSARYIKNTWEKKKKKTINRILAMGMDARADYQLSEGPIKKKGTGALQPLGRGKNSLRHVGKSDQIVRGAKAGESSQRPERRIKGD